MERSIGFTKSVNVLYYIEHNNSYLVRLNVIRLNNYAWKWLHSPTNDNETLSTKVFKLHSRLGIDI